MSADPIRELVDVLDAHFKYRPLLPPEDGKVPDTSVQYDLAYRAESQFSAHPGLSALLRYLRWGVAGAADSVNEKPGPAFDGQDRLSALLTAYLARHVFEAFGVRVEPPIDDVFTCLAEYDAEADGRSAGQDEDGG